ncbi:hypothetical protein shim_14730 [Shimia sp. SK013]|uniref:DUF6455 family protein n=1 Tax=Shimia sp. SK013 TaxID=1389006 RepID=UPI0006B64679|nr:DUF6455 family protein [Shimia sp. SK013]KPA23178.1 hypothetical protein shim_14730 [Shimia sp. SK013]
MPNIPKLRRHVALMDEAAKRIGMDLQEAAIRGALAVGEIQQAVERCTRCPLPDVCETWRAPAENSEQRVPPFCQNRDLFNRISETLI